MRNAFPKISINTFFPLSESGDGNRNSISNAEKVIFLRVTAIAANGKFILKTQ